MWSGSPLAAGHDRGRVGRAASLSRRADARHRQAGRDRGPSRPERRRKSRRLFSCAALRPAAQPALVHRLDRDTSGCLVLGRHQKALEKLGLLFKQGKIAKIYWAIVEGNPAQDEGMIVLPLGRRDRGRGWWMKADPLGLPSQTSWRVLGRSAGPRISGACAADRTHAPASGSLRCARLADPGGCHLWAWRGDGVAAACPGDHSSPLQK